MLDICKNKSSKRRLARYSGRYNIDQAMKSRDSGNWRIFVDAIVRLLLLDKLYEGSHP